MNVLEIGTVFGFISVIAFGVAKVLGQRGSLVAVNVVMVDLRDLGGVHADVAAEELDVVQILLRHLGLLLVLKLHKSTLFILINNFD